MRETATTAEPYCHASGTGERKAQVTIFRFGVFARESCHTELSPSVSGELTHALCAPKKNETTSRTIMAENKSPGHIYSSINQVYMIPNILSQLSCQVNAHRQQATPIPADSRGTARITPPLGGKCLKGLPDGKGHGGGDCTSASHRERGPTRIPLSTRVATILQAHFLHFFGGGGRVWV